MTGPTVADKRLHPGTVALRWLAEAPQTIIGLPALLAFASDIGLWIALLIMATMALVTLGFSYVRWSRFKYGTGAHEIVIESGVFSRNRRTIPFSRIQDVDIERRLLHRIFGLAKINVESGAGGKDEGALDSVSIAEADQIRAAVRLAKGQMSPDVQIASEERDEIIFAMPLARVWKQGLFSFSFSSLAAIVGGLGYVLSQFDDWLGNPKDLLNRAQASANANFDPLWIVWGIALLLFLAMVTSVGKALLTNFDFRLTRDERGLRRVRGLFTRTEVMIPKKRVQIGLVTSNPVWSRIGHEGLALQTLGGGDAASGHQIAAPFAMRDEIVPIIAELPELRLPDATGFEPVSPRHRWRTIFEFPFIMIGGLIAGWFFHWIWIFSIPLLFILVGQWIDAGRHGYLLDGDMLFVKSGFWRRKLWLVPIRNAETVSIRRNWLQRKWGLATVLVDTAGATAFADPRIVDLDARVAKALAAHLIAIARQARGLSHADQGRRISDPSNA
jgi:putative membrane protein